MKTSQKILKQELQKLHDEEGRLTPENVVKAAANKKHPLHKYFEWNDGKASHAYRLHQARQLIRTVKVTITRHHKSYHPVAYVHDPEADKQGYVETESLMPATKRDQAKQVIEADLKRARAAISRARDHAFQFNLEGEFDEMVARLDSFGLRVLELV